MKLNQANQERNETGAVTALKNACVCRCRKALAQLAKVRAAIFDEARAVLNSPERLLRLSLNEAEALAWQTGYPHLVFPVLAAEKIEAVNAWSARQEDVRRASRVAA